MLGNGAKFKLRHYPRPSSLGVFRQREAGHSANKSAGGTVKANFILTFGAGQRGMVSLFLLMNRPRVSCDSRPEKPYTHLL